MISVIVDDKAIKKAKSFGITKKFDKQIGFLKTNSNYTSLDFKPLVGSGGQLWRFRINKHYWGFTYKPANNTIKVYDVDIHL
ncbi:MAG: hypothetical protein M1277_01845 [Patescibacteria group bacterium]|nr:hypothetical protein [Patescibacteria group bacterium]